MKSTDIEIFRCDKRFRDELLQCAEKMKLTKSAYIRWSIATCNRMVNTQFETEHHS